MDLLDVMLKRRSVRKYTDEEIPTEKLNKILQAGLLAPTSRNLKPCNFLVIDNKETLKKINFLFVFFASSILPAPKSCPIIMEMHPPNCR